MHAFWICFVPLFVAVDAIGVVPFFISLTEGVDEKKRRAVIFQSILTASAVALAFLAIGRWALDRLGITVSDFMIAGGILLLILSLIDLVTNEKRQRRVDHETLGAVPIGVPLLSGPAVITTSVLLANSHGILLTTAALLINLGIAGVLFWFAGPITRLLGNAGSRTISKMASLLLASIAVMLIRKGVVDIVTSFPR